MSLLTLYDVLALMTFVSVVALLLAFAIFINRR